MFDFRILYCHCANAKIMPESVKDKVLSQLCEKNFSFMAVADLCGVCAKAQQIISSNILNHNDLKVISCHQNAVRWLLDFAGLKDLKFTAFNMHSSKAEDIISQVSNGENRKIQNEEPHNVLNNSAFQNQSSISINVKNEEKYKIVKRLLDSGFNTVVFGDANSGFSKVLIYPTSFHRNTAKNVGSFSDKTVDINNLDNFVSELERIFNSDIEISGGQWYPWFPIINYDKCTNCMQCLSFCLFGVYGCDEEGKLRVVEPDKCKPNCPACARVCPGMAIIFPKYPSAPINGGEIPEGQEKIKKEKVDISLLMGGNLYETLKKRNRQVKERFSSERNPETALKERCKCLGELTKLIPPEILSTLPSKQEMEKRATEAAEKASQALKNKKKLEK